MNGNIDGDLVAFRCAASVALKLSKEETEGLSDEEIRDLKYPDDSEEIAVLRTDKLMQELLHFTSVDSYTCYLTGGTNFRKQINPQYKANRTSLPPKWLQTCREYLVTTWNAVVSDGVEADDLMGINQDGENSMIISLDKDMLMVPGWHYNWLHNEKTFTTPLDGIRLFYKQMMIGDVSDNIFGVDGIGKVKAAKKIDPLEEEQEMIETVLELYGDDVNRFYMNAQCLWIMQEEGVTWADRVNHLILPDQLRLVVEAK